MDNQLNELKRIDKAARREAHRNKMARKAQQRAALHQQLNTRQRVAQLMHRSTQGVSSLYGPGARFNPKTGQPHEHKREKARRAGRLKEHEASVVRTSQPARHSGWVSRMGWL